MFLKTERSSAFFCSMQLLDLGMLVMEMSFQLAVVLILYLWSSILDY